MEGSNYVVDQLDGLGGATAPPKTQSAYPQRIREGFRRLGVVVGVAFALIPALGVHLLLVTEEVSQTGDLVLLLLLIPAAYGIGYGPVRVLGWIVVGFMGGDKSS